MSRASLTLLFAGTVALLSACRGQNSEQSPVHMNPNMDSQPRFDPQSEAKIFDDRRTMRPTVEHVVARGPAALKEDEGFHYGREGDKWVLKIPIPVNEELLRRGQERYNIYCTPCHDKTAGGQGMVIRRNAGFPPPPNLLEDYNRKLPDGQIYSAILNGKNNMPSYAGQVTDVRDRWAIVAYVRALQFAANATMDDVPPEKRGALPTEANQ
jgi:mono/diheme cytochrome c family protein